MIKLEQDRASAAGGRLIGFCLLLSLLLCLRSIAEAKLYIDVTSPASRKLPIAIAEFSGPFGREVSDTVRDDLDFTGFFITLDRNAFIETSSQPFNLRNWSVLGADLVVKGTISGSKNLTATISLHDATEGKEIYRKEYQAEASLSRILAHAIANDIYLQITGEKGIFRTRIAFVTRQKAHDELSVMDWDGQRPTKLGIKASVLLGPRWSRDGSQLLYSAERNRQWGIYLLDFKKAMERIAFSGAGTNIAGDFLVNANEFTLSSSLGGNQEIYSYRISEAKLTRLTSSRGVDVSPAVSPDGSRIAFVSDRQGGPQIFIMGRDGYDVRRLTFSGSYNTAPSWSPKGDRIVFSGRLDGKNQIFTISPDGTVAAQLTDRGNNEDASFSPDGRFIVFTSDRDGERAVFIMRANGEGQKRITPRGVKAFGPHWSPD